MNRSAKQVHLGAFVPEPDVFSLSACGSGCLLCFSPTLRFGVFLIYADCIVKKENSVWKGNRKVLM